MRLDRLNIVINRVLWCFFPPFIEEEVDAVRVVVFDGKEEAIREDLIDVTSHAAPFLGPLLTVGILAVLRVVDVLRAAGELGCAAHSDWLAAKTANLGAHGFVGGWPVQCRAEGSP
jgi:hypothetical protein